MRVHVLGLLGSAWLAGCSFSSRQTAELPPDAAIERDAAIGSDATDEVDAAPAIDAPSAARDCVGAFINVCVDRPLAAIALTTQTLDTSASPLCTVYEATPALDACVIAGSSITVPNNTTVTVIGARPLVLIATGSITISGTLDAASHRNGTAGPAADLGPCLTSPTGPSVGTRGDGGGGGGGSFGAAGNNGGNGGSGGIGGGAGAASAPTTLRGGCPGSPGAGDVAGASGSGGGAVLLIARQALTIDGAVNASGAAGGGGARTSGGGGGGGSGGMIVLDAAAVAVPGICFANGGGGGEGSNIITSGRDGSESSAPSTAAAGGKLGTSIGGDGGDGGFGRTPGGAPGKNGTLETGINGSITQLGGGGGGGGGVGVIEVFAGEKRNTDDLNRVAPAPRNAP